MSSYHTARGSRNPTREGANVNTKDSQGWGSASKLDTSSEDALTSSILAIFQDNLGVTGLDPDSDFFAAGVDSLRIIAAARLLRLGLQEEGHAADLQATMAPRTIYAHHTPNQLAKHILQTVITGSTADDDDTLLEERRVLMQQLYKKYTTNLAVAKPDRPPASASDQVVILTGSTSTFGSHILEALARAPSVAKIICLNEDSDGGQANQAAAMSTNGLPKTYTSKTEFHQVDVTLPYMGLSPDVGMRLLDTVDTFIHNAWPTNFNLALQSFEPQLQAVRGGSDMAASARKRINVLCISAIAVMDGWNPLSGPVPEARLEDFGLPGTGYGQSKMLGNIVLDAGGAPDAGDFPTAHLRLGHLAGPVTRDAGEWDRDEWLPSLIASSLYMKALPADLGGGMGGSEVDWLPVESLAAIVLELSGVTVPFKTSPDEMTGYYHGVNPSRAKWADMAAAARDFYGADRLPETVSFGEWVARLERTSLEADGDVESVRRNPAVKLLDLYKGMAKAAADGKGRVEIETTRTEERSPTMRASKAVTAEMMKHWCKQWDF